MLIAKTTICRTFGIRKKDYRIEERANVMDDFDRVQAWTEMLSLIAEQRLDDNVPPDRTFDFQDYDFSKLA